jgi:hypothetical protein
MNGTILCDMRHVESSQISRVGYLDTVNSLLIEFKGTPPTIYMYMNVSKEQYALLMNGESVGSNFYKYIKNSPEIHCIKLPTPLSTPSTVES